MTRALAEAGRPYVSHLGSYGAEVRAGLKELVAVGQAAGIRVRASHLSARRPRSRLRSRPPMLLGVGVDFDMYPYRKSSTILAVLLLPPEVQALGLRTRWPR